MRRLLRCASVAALLVVPTSTFAQSLGPPVSTWAPNGGVKTLALDGHTLYVGGEFDVVGPTTGSFGVADAGNATAITTGAAITDSTSAIVADGAGGWFVATEVAFASSAGILHVRADGTRDPAWTAPVFDRGPLAGLVLESGRLIVGGGFLTVNGTSRPGLAALDPSSGSLLAWDPRLTAAAVPPGGSFPPVVFRMAGAAGRLYVHGYFDSAGGAPRTRFAVLDATTGDALPGTLPTVATSVLGLTASATRVYVHGDCLPNSFVVCAYGPDMTPVSGWTFPPSLGQLAIGPTALYSVESSLVGPPYGVKVTARDLNTGVALPFAAPVMLGTPGTTVGALAVAGNTLYIAGDFVTVNGVRRWRMAAVDATSGALEPWAPLAGGLVHALAVAGNHVAFGGAFRVAGGIAKRNLVALDLRTGLPGPATPDLPFNVAALLKLGGVMVAGGDRPFGTSGPDLTAFTTGTGALLPWALESNGAVSALASDGRRLFIGGRFSLLSGALRLNVAAVDIATARLTSWNPQPDGPVLTLAVDGPTLFAGGLFYTLKGYGRPLTAAFDTATGDVLSFTASVQPLAVPYGFGFAPGRVLLATDDFQLPYAARPLVWLDRVSGAPVAPLGVSFRAGSATASDGTLFLAGNTATGTSALLGIDIATGRTSTWGLDIDSQATSQNSLAVNAEYVAAGVGFIYPGSLRSLVVYHAPRTGAPRQIQSAITGSTVTLGWQPGSGPPTTAFLVEAGTSTGGTDVGTFNVGVATRVAGALAPGTYYIRVRGLGVSGAGAASSEVIATVPPTSTPPSAPGTLSAAVSGGVVTLSWGAAAGNATSYVIEAGTAAGLTNIGALPTGHLDTTWSTPAPPGTYFVRVRATNAFGPGAPSNEARVVVP
jgi:hypothetical protein